MRNEIKWSGAALGAVMAIGLGVGLLPAAAQAPADPLAQSIDGTVQSTRAAAASQTRINQLDDQTRQLLDRYRTALWQSQQLNTYAQQLNQLLASQAAEIRSLQAQLADLERVDQDLMPLMLRMLSSLEQFVQLDLPFLAAERRERIDGLRRTLADGQAGTAEKFRRLLEAYQVEVEYGRTLGAERSEADGRLMDQLRVGRVALYALNLEADEALMWDATARKWEPLPRRYVASIKDGLKMARETAAVHFLQLPVPAATGAQP